MLHSIEKEVGNDCYQYTNNRNYYPEDSHKTNETIKIPANLQTHSEMDSNPKLNIKVDLDQFGENGGNKIRKRKAQSLGSFENFRNNKSNENLSYLENFHTTAAGVIPNSANSISNSSMLKRRFVWPQSLHQDFIGAVFDIGLRYANPRDVLSFMNLSASDGRGSTSNLNHELLKSQILKYQLFRDQRFFPRKYFYDIERANYEDPLSSFSEYAPGLPTFTSNSTTEVEAPSSSKGPSGAARTPSTSLDRQSKSLEAECQELMRMIQHQLIKLDYVFKTEQDMMTELNNLFQKQNEQKSNVLKGLSNLLSNEQLPDSLAFHALADALKHHLPAINISGSYSNTPMGVFPNDFMNLEHSEGNNAPSSSSGEINKNQDQTQTLNGSGESLAEIAATKYRSIIEMKDHIKLHRVLMQRHDSQLHGQPVVDVNTNSQGQVPANNHASVEFEGATSNGSDPLAYLEGHTTENYDGTGSEAKIHESPNDMMISKWLDDHDDDLFSFLLEN